MFFSYPSGVLVYPKEKNWISSKTARRLTALLGGIDEGFAYPRKGGSGPRLVVALCQDATAEGGNDLLDQCYPATIIEAASDIIYPPEGAVLPNGTLVLLTVLGSDGEAVVPVTGKPYLGVLTGDVETDGSGSLIGRPRVVSLEDELGIGGPIVSTDNAIVRWDGTTGKLVQNSLGIIDDAGNVYVTAVRVDSGPTLQKRDSVTFSINDGIGGAASPDGDIAVKTLWINNTLTRASTLPSLFTSAVSSGDVVAIGPGWDHVHGTGDDPDLAGGQLWAMAGNLDPASTSAAAAWARLNAISLTFTAHDDITFGRHQFWLGPGVLSGSGSSDTFQLVVPNGAVFALTSFGPGSTAAYAIWDTTGSGVSGGTIVTGGMTFVGGLYISGSAAASDIDGGTW